MFGCRAASTIRGVRMHWEQSRVGKVSDSWLMCPPMDGDFSTSTTWCPELAMSSAAWIPAMPPPSTSARLVTGTWIGCSGWLRLTFSTITRTRSAAFSVVTSPFSCTQEQCSRRLAISHRYGFSPASATALRKVGSCIRGEQAATTTPVSWCSRIASLIMLCPGSEHMYL